MKKISLMLCVILMAVAIMVTSLAWFTNNMHLYGNKTQVEAGKDISTSVVYRRIENGKYNGETGRGTVGDVDAPYFVPFYIFMTNVTLDKTCGLLVDLKKFVATRGDPATPPYLAESDNVATEFTWRFKYGGVQYRPNESGMAVNVSDGTYFEVPEGNVTLLFDLIYLSENRYQKWQDDAERSYTQYDKLEYDPILHPYLEWVKTQKSYFEYNDFAYSDPMFMNSTFYFDLYFGIMAQGGSDEETT